MIQFRLVLVIFFAIIFTGCSGGDATDDDLKNCIDNIGQTTRQDSAFCNITILLDLSNRIENELQTERDLDLITTILDVFHSAKKEYGFQFSKDRLAISICRQKNDKVSLNNDQNNLIIDMDRENSQRMNFPTFCGQKEKFISGINDVYTYSNKNKKFYGADVWNFFKDDYLSLIKKGDSSSRFKNKVIILTDGYLNFEREIEKKRPAGTFMKGFNRMRNKKDWLKRFDKKNYKLIPHDQNYLDVEVLIFEVDPKSPTINTNEFDILSHYWKTWFKDMNIPCEVYQKSKPAKDLLPIIKEFLY
jgi:hypothetical protein